ncbi:MAG: CRISPR-associated protein Cas4 [Nitrosopumilus sp.]|nr:CRISPR-associated protein Cas4 [Nitrosopumilus sp.]
MRFPLTVTDVVEYAFCPKFTYFINILGLEQFEQKRGTVSAGLILHRKHERDNLKYIPKEFTGKKIIAHKFFSTKHGLSGKIDEAIETSNEIVLIERKYSDNHKIYPSLKIQLGLLSVLIEDNLHKPVHKAIVIFSKTKRKEVYVKIDDVIKKDAILMLNNTKQVISNGIMPESNFDNRCLNCCFRKICPVGSLNTTE